MSLPHIVPGPGRISLLIGLGSALGGLSRVALGMLVGEDIWLGTALVNLLGSALIGYVFVMTQLRPGLPAQGRTAQASWQFLGTGFCGGFTTFSLLSKGVWLQLLAGAWVWAASYALGTLLLGIAAAACGYQLAQWRLRRLRQAQKSDAA